MKTPAIIASLTVAGSIAFAAGQQSGGRQSPPMPSGARAHSMQEEMPQGRSQMSADCAQGPAKAWFTIVHLRPLGCDIAALYYNSAADVDGDGAVEFVRGSGGRLVYQGEDTNPCCLYLEEVQTQEGTTRVTTTCVFAPEAVTALARAAFPNAPCIEIGYQGLRDMDGDRDLDVVAYLVSFPECGGNVDPQGDGLNIWIENTGFQHNTRLTGDLDGDGSVNGADLGILLFNWQN